MGWQVMKTLGIAIGAILAAGALWWRSRSLALAGANDVQLIDPVISLPDQVLNFLDDIGMA